MFSAKLRMPWIFCLVIFLSASPAFGKSNGEAKDSGFKIDIVDSIVKGEEAKLKTGSSTEVTQTHTNVTTAVNLIYFDKPSAPGKAPVQRGASLREGSYCLAAEGEVGTLGLVPSDWNDGRESPYALPQGRSLGCIPLSPADLEAAGLELTEENGQTVLRTIRVTLTTHDFDTFPITAATPQQERAPHTLKNYNTNFWADPNPQEFTRTINGQNVVLRATPVSYTFDYGDGTTLGPVAYPGYQLGADVWDQPTDTSHRYTAPGDYYFSLTTTYRGEYSVDGGPWQVIDGTVSRTSDPQLVRVWRTKVGLVADDCAAGADAWGCTTG